LEDGENLEGVSYRCDTSSGGECSEF